MNNRTRKITGWILMALPSLMLLFSGFLKISGNEMMVSSLSKIGFGSLISILGIAEWIFVILFFIPRTYKIGFLLILSYLGGAAAIEISEGRMPLALLLIALAWAGVYLKDKENFYTGKYS